jgi:hypothetical protein
MHKVYILILCSSIAQAMQTAQTTPVTNVEAQQLQTSITDLLHATDTLLQNDTPQNFATFDAAKTNCIARHRNVFDKARNCNAVKQAEKHKLQKNFDQVMNKLTRYNLN